jgi:hypothetical protein
MGEALDIAGIVAAMWLTGGMTLLILDAFEVIERDPVGLARAARALRYDAAQRRVAARYLAWRLLGYPVLIARLVKDTAARRRAKAAAGPSA